VEATGPLTPVWLDGSASDGPGGGPPVFEWQAAGGRTLGLGPRAEVGLPPGAHTVTLVVSDGVRAATDDVRITVTDGTAPEVRLVDPPRGTRAFGNVPHRIEWASDDLVGVSAHGVLVSMDGGPWSPLPGCEVLDGASSSCTWARPGPAGGHAVFRVVARDAAGNVASDASDTATAIVPRAVVRLRLPPARADWRIGSVVGVRWIDNLGPASRVDLDLSRDGGATWEPLAQGLAADPVRGGTFPWTVTGPPAAAAVLRARWRDHPEVEHRARVRLR
jgi:hypothetical protein